jgi:ribosome-associated translation inhibitor RaiA
MTVELTVQGDLPAAEADRARRRIADLQKYAREAPQSARLTLRLGGASRIARIFYVADASLVLADGRLLAAHATGDTVAAAGEEVADRLLRQVRRAVGSEVARRNEPAVIRKGLSDLNLDLRYRPASRLKPPEEREIVVTRQVPEEPVSTLGAVADLVDHDLEFSLVRHVRTGEDLVVFRRDDGNVGLLHPPGSDLADENDIVIPEPSRYPQPITLADARSEMDVLNHRFLYFIDAADGRGRALYLRHDGDYGMVEFG